MQGAAELPALQAGASEEEGLNRGEGKRRLDVTVSTLFVFIRCRSKGIK